ncbi:MAG: hypothetical protein ACRDO9_02445, partial [Gaiellales bacterium]
MGESRAEQELRTMAANRDFEVRELTRPLSAFDVSDRDAHMRGFVWRAGGPSDFGMDDACEMWANLPLEIRCRARRYRREALELARREQLALPETIKPPTWR